MLIADELTSNALRHGGTAGRDGAEPAGRPVAGRRQRLLRRRPPGAGARAATPGSAVSASTWWPTSPPRTAGRLERGAKSVWAVVEADDVETPADSPRAGVLAGNLRPHVARRAAGHGHRRLRGQRRPARHHPDLRVDEPGHPMPSSASSRCTTRTPSARPSSAPAPPPSSGPPSASTAASSGWPPGAATSPAG